MPKIAIRTKGANGHGAGHIVRMGSLAQHLTETITNLQIELLIEGSYKAREWGRNTGIRSLDLGSNLTVGEEAEVLRNSAADLFIIDVLEISPSHLSLYQTDPRPLVLFSDLGVAWEGCDLLIHPQTLPPSGIATSTNTLSGPKYFIVDKKFQEAWATQKKIPKQAENLLICMGGEAKPSTLRQLAQFIERIAKKWTRVEWILGYVATHVKEALPNLPKNVFLYEFVDNLSDRLRRSDLAIVAGGFVKFDAACCGTPIVIISQYDHQKPLAQAFERTGAGIYVGDIEEIQETDFLEILSDIQNSKRMRLEMSRSGKQLIDSRGSERITSEIIKLMDLDENTKFVG